MIGRSTHNFLLRVSITRYSYFLNKHVSIPKLGVSLFESTYISPFTWKNFSKKSNIFCSVISFRQIVSEG